VEDVESFGHARILPVRPRGVAASALEISQL